MVDMPAFGLCYCYREHIQYSNMSMLDVLSIHNLEQLDFSLSLPQSLSHSLSFSLSFFSLSLSVCSPLYSAKRIQYPNIKCDVFVCLYHLIWDVQSHFECTHNHTYTHTQNTKHISIICTPNFRLQSNIPDELSPSLLKNDSVFLQIQCIYVRNFETTQNDIVPHICTCTSKHPIISNAFT